MMAILTDEAGHTTNLTFEKTKDYKGFVFVRLLALEYDGEETPLKDTALQYKWRIDKQEKYRFFASSLKTENEYLTSRYFPKKDETWFWERPESLQEEEINEEEEEESKENKRIQPVKERLSGMIVPYMESNKGEIGSKY